MRGPRLPSFVIGTLARAHPAGRPIELALVNNGTIVGLTRSFLSKEGNTGFASAIAERHFVQGENILEVFEVVKRDQQVALRRFRL